MTYGEKKNAEHASEKEANDQNYGQAVVEEPCRDRWRHTLQKAETEHSWCMVANVGLKRLAEGQSA